MSQDTLKKFVCSVCKSTNYYKRVKDHPDRKEKKREIQKFCKRCRKHTVHKIGKKK